MSMKTQLTQITCQQCGHDAEMLVATNVGTINIDKAGLVTFSNDPSINVGDHISTFFNSIVDFIDGICNNCQDEVAATFTFSDGSQTTDLRTAVAKAFGLGSGTPQLPTPQGPPSSPQGPPNFPGLTPPQPQVTFTQAHQKAFEAMQEKCYKKLHPPRVIKIDGWSDSLYYVCQECLEAYLKKNPDLKKIVISFGR